MFDLGKIIDVYCATPYTAAGTSTITSATAYSVPSDCDHILCLAWIGTAAADNTLGINGATAVGGSYSLLGTAVASDGTDVLIAKEVKNLSSGGFLKAVVTRGTSTTINAVIFIAYKKKSGAATVNDWTTSASYNLQVAPTLA